MALIHQDGFEIFGPNFPLTRDYIMSGSWDVQQSGRFSDSKSVRGAGGDTLTKGLPSTLSTIAAGLSMKIDNLSSSTSNGPGVSFVDVTGTVRFSVQINSLGQIIATNNNFGSGVVGTSASVVSTGAWFHLGIEIVRHDSTGSVNVYFNGARVISVTNVNTGGADFAAVRILTAPGGGVYTYVDDLYVNNVASWSGECRVSPLVPTADTAQKDFVPSTGSDNYACVDDQPASTDDWVSSSTVGAKDLYELGDLPFTPLAIIGVRVLVVAKKDDITTRTFRPILRSGGTSANGATKSASSDYAIAYDIFEKDPNTSAAWTKSGVDALQVGVEVVA